MTSARIACIARLAQLAQFAGGLVCSQPIELTQLTQLAQGPHGGLRQCRAQHGVHGRKHGPRALHREHAVLVQRGQQRGRELHVQPQAFAHALQLRLAGVGDQALIGRARQRRKNQVLVAQSRHLFGPETSRQRLLHVDAGQALCELVEHVGVGVAVLHAAGHALVHLVEVAGHHDQQLAVVAAPGLRVGAKSLQALAHLLGRPAHDFGDGRGEFQRVLNVARVPDRQVVGRDFALRAFGARLLALGLVVQVQQLVGRVGGVFGLLVLAVGQLHLDAVQRAQRRRHAPVRQQLPHVLVALDRQVFALAVDGAKALELVEQQDARLALRDGRAAQHGRDRVAPLAAVAEAVHLHFDEAVVQAQELRHAAHQLGFAGAGQAPQADDDRALHQLGQQVPGAHRVHGAVDQCVQAKQLGFQLAGCVVEHALALAHATVQRGQGAVARRGIGCVKAGADGRWGGFDAGGGGFGGGGVGQGVGWLGFGG